MCGAKVSIVSRVPQTTRNRIRGIYTCPSAQLLFLDTPGFHISQKKLNLYLTSLVTAAIKEADIVLYVVDGTRSFGSEENAIADAVRSGAKPVALALNKLDAAGKTRNQQRKALTALLPQASVFDISAISRAGLAALVEKLCELAPIGEALYPPEYYTDQSVDFRISEILREKAIGHTRQELPHALYVKLEDLEMKKGGSVLWVRGAFLVERESQKGILVGAGGQRIKRIVQEAEDDLRAIFPYSVDLDIRVKVDKDWRKRDSVLRRLIQ